MPSRRRYRAARTRRLDPTVAVWLDQQAHLFELLHAQLAEAREAAAYGPGQADMRTYQRVGYDPTAGKLDGGQAYPCGDCPADRPCDVDEQGRSLCQRAGEPRDGPTWQREPALRDGTWRSPGDLRELEGLHKAALQRVRRDTDWLAWRLGEDVYVSETG